VSAIHDPVLSRRERWWLGGIVVAPAVLFLIVRLLGYMNFALLGAAGVVAVAGSAFLFVKPRWGLYAIIFYVYAGLSFYFSFFAVGAMSVIVIAAVVIDLMFGAENRLTDSLFWYAVGMFLLIAIGSMVFAMSPKLSLIEISNYLKMVALAYVIVHLIRTPRELRMLMYVVFAGALATVFLGVMNLFLGIQNVGDNYIGGSEYMLRFMGTHENPNRAAAFMCTAVPFGIFGLKWARRRYKPFWILALAILVIAVYATFSRSVAFPLAMIAVAVVAREVRSRRSFTIVAALVALALVATPKVWWERVLGLGAAFQTTTLDWSVYTRLMALHTAWEMFLHHPITGIGIGNFIVAAAYKVFLRIVVHNTYLETAVGTGIFGLAAFLFILASGFRHTVDGVRDRWEGQPEWMRSACFYCALSAVSIWMSAFFGTMPFRHPFWVPIATGLVIANLLRNNRAAPAAR
jgi:putative inorganic carbon (HCO3(-)) transporter